MTDSADLPVLLARLQRLEDLQAIHQLFVDYGDRLDAGDLDGYADLFTDDGELLLGPLGRAQGRDAIKEMMAPSLAGLVGRSFHQISNPRVTLDGDRATAVVMWTVIQVDDAGRPVMPMMGHHEDDLVRDGGRWRIRRRKGFVDIPAAMPRRD